MTPSQSPEFEVVQQRRPQQLVRTAAHQHHLGDPPVSPCFAVVGLAVGKPLRGLGKARPILLRVQRAQQANSRRGVHSRPWFRISVGTISIVPLPVIVVWGVRPRQCVNPAASAGVAGETSPPRRRLRSHPSFRSSVIWRIRLPGKAQKCQFVLILRHAQPPVGVSNTEQ